MKSLAALAPRPSAEAVRRRLKAAGVLRAELLVGHDGDLVAFPITERLAGSLSDVRYEDREFEERPSPRASSYRELARVPEAVRSELPRAFDVVGDVVLLRLPETLRPYSREVGAALLAFVPGARVVGLDHGVHGEARRRTLERVAGEGPWTTVHRENDIVIDVDLERAYFSPRLAREHARVAAQVRDGERVIDFACGVAPFGAHILRDGRAREVVAVDANPDATALAERNLHRVAGDRSYRVVTGTIEAFAPASGGCERAILNLPHAGVKYLPSVAATVGRAGALHFYERTPRAKLRERPEELVNAVRAVVPGSWSASDVHVVHPYSPTEDIVAFRLTRE